MSLPARGSKPRIDQLSYVCEKVESRYECNQAENSLHSLSKRLCRLTCKDKPDIGDARKRLLNHMQVMMDDPKIVSTIISLKVAYDKQKHEVACRISKAEHEPDYELNMLEKTDHTLPRKVASFDVGTGGVDFGGVRFSMFVSAVPAAAGSKDLRCEVLDIRRSSYFFDQPYNHQVETFPVEAYFYIPELFAYVLCDEATDNRITLMDAHRRTREEEFNGVKYKYEYYTGPLLFLKRGYTFYENKGYTYDQFKNPILHRLDKPELREKKRQTFLKMGLNGVRVPRQETITIGMFVESHFGHDMKNTIELLEKLNFTVDPNTIQRAFNEVERRILKNMKEENIHLWRDEGKNEYPIMRKMYTSYFNTQDMLPFLMVFDGVEITPTETVEERAELYPNPGNVMIEEDLGDGRGVSHSRCNVM